MEYEMGRGLGARIGVGPENRNSTQTTKIGEERARNPREEKQIEENSSQIHLQMETAMN